MTEVSKLVRARLAKAAVAGPHPDADQLTAFAERVLRGREREQMLAHLASCAGCREVVALAAPELAAAAAAAPAKPKWLPWPVLRWGAAAAVVLVVVAVWLESPRTMQAPRQAVQTQAPQPQSQDKALLSSNAAARQAPAEQTRVATPAATDKARAADERKTAAVAELGKRENVPGAPPPKTGRAADAVEFAGGKATGHGGAVGASGGPAQATVASNEASNGVRNEARTEAALKDGKLAQSPAKEGELAEKRAAAEPTAVEPMATEPTAEAGSSGKLDTLAAAKAPPAPAPVARPKSAPSTSDNAYFAPGFKGEEAKAKRADRDAQMRAQLKPAVLRWTVTSDGRVERSADAGRSWSDVVIARDVRFRALASDGDQVWAGGNNAALFHSPDAGKNWKKVTIDDLRGDVVRLVINGKTLIISTSSGQTIAVSHDELNESPAKSPSPR